MFHSNDIHSSNTETSQHSSLSFVPPQSQEYKRYSLDLNTANAVRMQELFVEQDEAGKIKAASYDSGALVRHLDSYTMVRAANSSLWMGDRFGAWHPLD
jgi:hypothetical protein